MRGSTEKIIYGGLGAGALGSFAAVYWWIDAIGILLGLMIATATMLVVTGKRSFQTRLIFTYGYHAGYHAAPGAVECFGPSCPVLDIAAERVEQMARVSTP